MKATAIVYWPGKATHACDVHLGKLIGLSVVLNFDLQWNRITEEVECENCANEARTGNKAEVRLGNEVTVVETCCPHCGHRFDRASHASMTETYQPKKDDVSVCIECAAILIYTDNIGNLRAAGREDIAALMEVPQWAEIEKVQSAVAAVRTRYQKMQ